MLHNLDIKSFRAFEHVGLSKLKRVNLIVGSNDVGKTSILEALVLMLGSSKNVQELPGMFRSTTKQNQDAFENFWAWLFFQKDQEKPFELASVYELTGIKFSFQGLANQPGVLQGVRAEGRVEKKLLSYRWDHHPPRVVVSDRDTGLAKLSVLAVTPTEPSEDAELFNLVAPLNPAGEEKIESAMREIEPSLRRLRYAKLPNTSGPLVYADLGMPKAIPSTQMGQAFSRILHIYCQLMASGSKMLLVDEIENGIYFANLAKFWRGILATLSDLDVQMFSTTHSWECLTAAHREACARADKNGGTYDLNVIRLDRVDWGIKATEFGREEMEAAIANGWDMR
jgi:hypothetical protein